MRVALGTSFSEAIGEVCIAARGMSFMNFNFYFTLPDSAPELSFIFSALPPLPRAPVGGWVPYCFGGLKEGNRNTHTQKEVANMNIVRHLR